jgi:tetratricopeptide (TPR) repeat protein
MGRILRSLEPFPPVALYLASALALAAFGASCSSAPKAPDAVYDARNKAAELAKLGDGFMAKAIYAQALQYYGDALAASSAVDDLEGVTAEHVSMGRAYLAAGETAAAETEYEAASEYARMSGSSDARSTAKAGLGEIAYAKGDKDGALSLFEEAVALASTAAKDGKALAIALHDRGVAKAALARTTDALGDFAKAEALNLKAKRWTELGANRYAMASALAASGRPADALAAALGALDADKRGENARAVPLDLAAAASLSSKLGKDAEAWDYWHRSFDSAMAAGDPASVRKSLGALVELAKRLERTDDGAHYAALLAKLDEAEATKSPAGQ